MHQLPRKRKLQTRIDNLIGINRGSDSCGENIDGFDGAWAEGSENEPNLTTFNHLQFNELKMNFCFDSSMKNKRFLNNFN